ncbi:Inner membrane symporter YicJ [compost metagenome]
MTEKITRKEKISYGLGDMASHIGLDNVIIFLTFYYTDVVGLPAAFVGTMFLLARTADAIIDPAMGYIADRTRTRWGNSAHGCCGLLCRSVPVVCSPTLCLNLLIYMAK